MANRTSIRQALHLSLGLTFTQIASLTGSDPSSIRKAIFTGKTWAQRSTEDRTDAIAAARRLVEKGGL